MTSDSPLDFDMTSSFWRPIVTVSGMYRLFARELEFTEFQLKMAYSVMRNLGIEPEVEYDETFEHFELVLAVSRAQNLVTLLTDGMDAVWSHTSDYLNKETNQTQYFARCDACLKYIEDHIGKPLDDPND